MRRTATHVSPLLIAGAAVAALVVVALGLSAMRPAAAPAKAAAVPPPAATMPVAIAQPAPPAPIAARAAEAPVATAARMPEPVGSAGMRVAIDPETGMLTAPTTGEAFSQSDERLTETTLPDGSVMVDLDGRYQEYSVMTRDAAGKLQVRCVHDPAKALDPKHVCQPVETALPSAER